MVFAVLLLFCVTFSIQFYLFYLLGGFTDMMDGWAARKLNLKSAFGAKLDTIADHVFFIAVLIKILPARTLPPWMWVWIVIIAFMKLTNLASSLVLFRRIVSVHSVMNKVTGFFLFLLPLTLSCIDLKYSGAVVSALATFAAVQEGYYICTGKEIE